MLNNRKVRLMTRLAMYEQKEGKEDIRISKYFRSDFVRLNVLKSVVAITFGYLLILVLLIVYHSEYLIREAVTLDYKGGLLRYAGIYVAILAIYVAFGMIGYMIKYRASRKKLAKYFRMLRRLRTIYREEDGELTGVQEEVADYDRDDT